MQSGQAAAAELDDLRWHWGGAYEITEACGVWRAARQDTGRTLIATAAGDLHALIVADYTRRPVPRL